MKITKFKDKLSEYDKLEREQLIKKFPYSVIVEGNYPEHDFATNWCWKNFGPINTQKCYDSQSNYPSCPIALATGKIQKYRDPFGEEKLGMVYDWEVPAHAHQGKWAYFWLDKTDYDYGFAEFLFAEEKDKNLFVENVSMFNMGEKYRSQRGEKR